MARNWIVIGDPTSSGGSVVSGSPFTDIDGIPVARVTDQATCPKHKGAYPIVDGDNTLIVDGQPVALHGSSLACGCKVLSAQQVRVFVDAGGGGRSGGGGGGSVAAIAGAAAAAVVAAKSAVNDASEDESTEYDEALCFCSESGEPLAGVRYTLYFANGDTCTGTTDDNGMTERVCTCRPEAFVKAVLAPPEPVASCCGPNEPVEVEQAEISLEGISTSDVEVGASVVTVTARGKDRSLTSGEEQMARRVFGDSIDYSRVKLHNHEYWLTLGFQKDTETVAPNGNIYFGEDNYREDFSAETPRWKQHFIHEMAHVWQYQMGYAVLRTRVFRPRMGYEYEFESSKKLCDYNMEQQGDILGDYYLTEFLSDNTNTEYFLRHFAKHDRSPSLDIAAELRNVLVDFISDPKDPGNLPNVKK